MYVQICLYIEKEPHRLTLTLTTTNLFVATTIPNLNMSALCLCKKTCYIMLKSNLPVLQLNHCLCT